MHDTKPAPTATSLTQQGSRPLQNRRINDEKQAANYLDNKIPYKPSHPSFHSSQAKNPQEKCTRGNAFTAQSFMPYAPGNNVLIVSSIIKLFL